MASTRGVKTLDAAGCPNGRDTANAVRHRDQATAKPPPLESSRALPASCFRGDMTM